MTSKMTRAFLVDTRKTVNTLAGKGIPVEQAEAITMALKEVFGVNIESVSERFISKAELERNVELHKTTYSNIEAEVKRSNEDHSLLMENMEKKHGTSLANYYKGEAHAVDSALKLANLNNIKEICELRAELEATKFSMVKLTIGTILTVASIGGVVVAVMKDWSMF
ncbi:hypothetical protein SSX86_005015 [Deinandra increscens subsp. villosa]|uniref:Uncharacterized protein n=1 Tax=Deinandra increscens subsp. villosa TaxID=3103831 RepID=A0AAP0H9E2_9ASTR